MFVFKLLVCNIFYIQIAFIYQKSLKPVIEFFDFCEFVVKYCTLIEVELLFRCEVI